ncbi:putative sensor histidine kinase VirS [Marvinbryantia formatexigens DSM 14469]|uniref:Sensor histidine kinase VirS n=1 Tax=Marvinbryantia formatexigens DSM 14469 TaxID=478749 RepID=C6LEK4_9FIRM|nr:ATP-binding protein [Marvinbryantia formatexigens]EET60987.1 putative sensor histidine kinase VirS [Marvinbryantia formatexigens DSM 14469]UWO24725.1 ATP-binding protein [Marvinbryantia formatexigens DSM 14469]SDF20780.1 GHKL domain-containing protein [Marvinbryantia formatexigens]
MIAGWAVFFLQNDLNFFLSMCAGVTMAGQNLKKRSRFWVWLLLYALMIFAWSMAFYLTDRKGWVKYLIAYAVTAVWTLLVFQCRLITALYCVTVAYCLEHIAQRGHELLCTFLRIPDGPYEKIVLYAAIALVFFAGYFLALKGRTFREEDMQGEDRVLIVLAFFVILADIVISITMMGVYSATGNETLKICTHLMSMMISVLALTVCVSRFRESAARREQQAIRQLLDMEQEKYQREKAVTEVINRKCHDLKYYLEGLKERMSREELQEISQAVDVYESGFHTGNGTLDVVLANKNLLCQSRQIEFTCIADGKILAFMEEQDIYALFGNLLDNSIEAVQKVSNPEKRVISMTVTEKNGLGFIHMENYYQEEILFENGMPKTTKQDRQYHGYGTQSIRYLAEKYGGDVQMQTEQDIFLTDIMIPLRSRKS